MFNKTDDILLRQPTPTDGPHVSTLIAQCPPLDTNSPYCNLLQCTHFSATSVVALVEGKVAGFVSGYLEPETPTTLFIWQVAVADTARGIGLATRMLQHIIERPQCQHVNQLETTITSENQASWSLFTGFASKHNANLTKQRFFEREKHFDNKHMTEYLVQISPLIHATYSSPSNNAPHIEIMTKEKTG